MAANGSVERQTSPSRSRVALLAFSTVAVAVLTTFSYFQWSSTRSQQPTPILCKDIEEPEECEQVDDHQSDSESAEIDSTPPSSPCPQTEKMFHDDPEEDSDEVSFHTKMIDEHAVTQKMCHPSAMSVIPDIVPTQRQIHGDERTAEAVEEKKTPELYREDAIRMFKGFAKNQRSKKGISLKSACLVYKEAWSINKNPRDIVLPGRVISHFKRALPSRSD